MAEELNNPTGAVPEPNSDLNAVEHGNNAPDTNPTLSSTSDLAGDVNRAVEASIEAAETLAEAAIEDPEAVAAALATLPTGDLAPAAQLIGGNASPAPLTAAAAFESPDFGAAIGRGAALSSINLIDDVELDVTVELGRTEMFIDEILKLGVGSVVELDKLAGDPVDVYVNNRLVARGEVLVLNDNFCVRVSDIQSPIPELDESK